MKRQVEEDRLDDIQRSTNLAFRTCMYGQHPLAVLPCAMEAEIVRAASTQLTQINALLTDAAELGPWWTASPETFQRMLDLELLVADCDAFAPEP